ncbi:MAG: ferric reductase-like transmembrane domain-containing protein [Coriobacteriales bacterium]|jgi:DMSO/TMAO reductase YedYZ heme-binding membrane subunit|nr:ferric reductase-like transmembrane domain-containing protein [Coriobacteriales bacterium]
MLFIVSLAVVLALALLFHKAIRALPALFYALTTLAILVLFAAYFLTDYETWPQWFTYWVVAAFARGTLSTSVFVIVMYLGVASNRVPGVEGLRAIRGELSILGCILALGHNIYYGMYYFPNIFSGELPLAYLISTWMSIILIAIMLPLTVTSVKAVRRKMRPASWKRLQRWAYGFYALLYVDTMLLFAASLARNMENATGLPSEVIQEQVASDIISLIAYSAVFLPYFVLRIRKAFRNSKTLCDSRA